MGMRVGFEEILDLKHFWDRLGGRLRESLEMKQLGFEKTELFHVLKDKGIRIFEKGIRILKKRIRIAYW